VKPYLKKLSVPVSLFILASGLAWVWLGRVPVGQNISPSIEAPQVGFYAPDFRLSGLDSEDLGLMDFEGSPLILNFWASWCPPCQAEMPAFQQVADEFANSDLQIIAVNATHQDSIADVHQFVEQYELTLPILLDQAGAVSRDYLIHSLPTTFFIGKDGLITEIVIGGPVPLSLLRIQADQLLSDK
jgi:thiol-disulfide isomerase/thioredoxin